MNGIIRSDRLTIFVAESLALTVSRSACYFQVLKNCTLAGGTPAKGQSCQPLAMTTKVFGLLSAHSRLRSSPDCSARPPGSIKKGAVFFVCLHVMTPRLQFGLGRGEPRNYSWECFCSDPVLLEQLTIVIGAPKC